MTTPGMKEESAPNKKIMKNNPISNKKRKTKVQVEIPSCTFLKKVSEMIFQMKNKSSIFVISPYGILILSINLCKNKISKIFPFFKKLKKIIK